MNTTEQRSIQDILCYWITFLSEALPLRGRSTFIELLVGSFMTRRGLVTEALLAISRKCHWTTYYKWIEQGRWSWIGLARQFTQLALDIVNPDMVYLAIDDTLTLRASNKAPGAKIHHQHGNKKNLAQYVLGQCWVSLALIARRANGTPVAIPLLSRLMPSITNTGKLVAALTLMRTIRGLLQHRKVTVLVDSWYMRGKFVLALVKQGYTIIGQVRRDTAFFDEPEKPKKPTRGRKRKYGKKITPKRVAHMKKTKVNLNVYGQEHEIQYREKVVLARFLSGNKVLAIWTQFPDPKGGWRKPCVLVSTDATMTAEQVIQAYALRWPIEPMFNDLKNSWGLSEAWQQTRQVLHRWVHLTQIGFGLLQLASLRSGKQLGSVLSSCPWRPDQPATPGNIRRGIETLFSHFRIQDWWDQKSRKLRPPESRQSGKRLKVA